MTIGQAIREQREAAGMTQTQAAAQSGMTASGWSTIESDQRDMRLSTYRRVCKALDVDAWALLRRAE